MFKVDGVVLGVLMFKVDGFADKVVELTVASKKGKKSNR